MDATLYIFPDYQQQGKKLAEKLESPVFEVKIHHFPDKESLVTLPAKKTKHVIFCLSLDNPNNKLIELLLACKTARKQGIKRISLLCPYLSYMRQDKSFHNEEAISQQIIGLWLSELFDDVITVDPHLHRVHSLDKVIPNTNNIVLSATPLLGSFVKSLKQPLHLMGPDEESLQWVQQVAKISNTPYSVAKKIRHSDIKVEIQIPDKDYSEQHIILIDDVISSGHTIAECANLLHAEGARQIDVLVTHALFSNDVMDLLMKSHIKNIWSSDSINHITNTIMLTSILSEKIKTLF